MRGTTLEEVQRRLHDKFGDLITIIPSSYSISGNKATFVDKDYGEWVATVDQILRGSNHPKRSRMSATNIRRIPLADIQNKLIKIHHNNVNIIPETYKSVRSVAVFVDRDFGEWQTNVSHVLKGSGHPARGWKSSAEKLKTPLHKIQEKIRQIHGDTVILITESYIGSESKAKFIDKDFGEFESKLYYIFKGKRHPKFGKIKQYKDRMINQSGCMYVHPVTHESLQNFARKYNAPLGTLTPMAKKFGVEKTFEYVLANLNENGKYKHKISSLELNFYNLLKITDINVIRWDRKIIEIKENIRPDFKLEYSGRIIYVDVHGLWYHCIDVRQDKNYHFNRREIFNKYNISYMQFFEDEVRYKSEIIKSMVLNHFGLAVNKYQARKLELREIYPKTAKEFFNTNHLMGNYSSAKAIGLFKDNDLVSCLSYRVYDNKVEISRFATKLNSSCAGGFGKLVHYFKQFNLPIVSYCDLRYATGKSYEALGFKDMGTTLGWSWTDGNLRFNRLRCRASSGKTEAQNAFDKKWYKIYDAGQRKYELQIF